MTKTSTFQTKFRRRREGKTNYVKRLALLKSKLPRFVVRRSAKHALCQFVLIKDGSDITVASAHSSNLKKFGWKMNTCSVPAAYLSGLLAGLRAKAKKIDSAVFDMGLLTPVHGSASFAALKGAIDAGVSIKFDESALPDENRIKGKHIEDFAKKLGAEELKKRFGACIAAGADPKRFVEHFEAVKKAVVEKGAK